MFALRTQPAECITAIVLRRGMPPTRYQNSLQKCDTDFDVGQLCPNGARFVMVCWQALGSGTGDANCLSNHAHSPGGIGAWCHASTQDLRAVAR